MSTLLDEAHALLPDVVALRRALHRVPEVGLELPETQRAVLDALGDLPIQITRGDKLSSIVGILERAHPGPRILLSASVSAQRWRVRARRPDSAACFGRVPASSQRTNIAPGKRHAHVLVVELHHAHEDLTDVFAALRTSENTSYVLSSSLRLVEVNEGWVQFALNNNGTQVLREWYPGRPILEGISEDLRPFFARGYLRALQTGARWDHDYECNSAIEYRKFRMTTLPSRTTLVVTHSPLIEIPMNREVFEATAEYVSRGFITICSHCRRTRNAQHPNRWDWVPSFIANMPDNVSHGLCPPCMRYYAEW